VTRGRLRLAVREYGGDGSPILLLHGAGRNLLDWDPVAESLSKRHRVAALDLRCHGQSGDAVWDWDEVCDDVLFVAEQLRMVRPAVVGHSLGGMIAAKCGRRPGAISAAINIDGHGIGRPEQYVGLTAEAVAEGRDRMRAMSESMTLTAAMTAEEAEAARQQALQNARSLGLSEQFADQCWQRSLQRTPDGVVTRPVAACMKQLLAAVGDLDLFEDYRSCTVPLLIFNATRPMPGAAPEWMDELMSALRLGLRRDLAQLEQECSHVRVVEMDATHALILTSVGEVAQRVLSFLGPTSEPDCGR
jgi:pimeloyl-ACP methyl ester carboxylesterase